MTPPCYAVYSVARNGRRKLYALCHTRGAAFAVQRWARDHAGNGWYDDFVVEPVTDLAATIAA